MKPDGINAGMTRELGWGKNAVSEDSHEFVFAPTTLGELVSGMAKRLNAHSMRVVGEAIGRGELKAVAFGSIHTVKPQFDRGIERSLDEYFSRYQTLSMASFKIGDDEVREVGRARELFVHPCRPVAP